MTRESVALVRCKSIHFGRRCARKRFLHFPSHTTSYSGPAPLCTVDWL